MKIQIKNISGIVNEEIKLNEGLNVIRAPNATGKTSVVNALKVSTLSEAELKSHLEYLNDFSNSGSVNIDGVSRTLTRTSTELLAGKNPIYKSNGKFDLLFADPDSDILSQVTKGKSIEEFIEKFSDVKVYQELNSEVVEQVIEQLKLYYNEDNLLVRKAKSIAKELESLETQKNKLLIEKKKMQPMIEKAEKLLANKEKVEKIKDEKNELIREESSAQEQIKQKSNELPSLVSEKKSMDKEIDDYKKQKAKMDKELGELNRQLGQQEIVLENQQKKLSDLDEHIEYFEQSDRSLDWTHIKSCPICLRPFTSADKRRNQAKLEKEREELNTQVLKIENNIKEIKDQVTKIENENNRISKLEDERDVIAGKTKKYTEQISELSTRLESIKKQMKKLDDEISKLEENLDSETKKVLEKAQEINQDIIRNEAVAKAKKDEIEEVKDAEKNIEVLMRKIEYMNKVKEKIKQIVAEKKDGVKQKFNTKISEVYSILGFKNFDKIFVNDNYSIEVVRKGRQQELNRLSTSERVTIGVIVMLAGKEEYLPDFPFFVMDEVVTAYDPTRFKKIIDYISEKTHTKYTIVTAFSPTGDKIKIERSI